MGKETIKISIAGCLTIRHSRPQSPSFLGHVVGKRGVGYKFSRVALGTRMTIRQYVERKQVKAEKKGKRPCTKSNCFSKQKLV